MTAPRRKRRQSPTRNADTQFINNMWRMNDEARAKRSQEIRERERQARERARAALETIIRADA